MDEPGVEPVAHEAPCVFCRSAGTNTWNAPAESTYRKGFSRVTGLWATVV
jgi:hypothetical protein